PRRDGGRGDRRGRRGRDRRSAAGQRGAGAAHCADHRDRDEAPTGRARGPRPPGRGAARRDGDGDRHRKRRRHRGARGVGRRQRRRPQRAGRGLGRRWCARRRSYARDARDGRRRGGRRGPSRPRRGLTPAAAPPDSCRSRGSAGVSEVQSPPEGGSLVAHRALRRRIPVANAGLGSIGPRGGGDAHTEGMDDETTGRRSRKSPWQRVGSVLGTATVLLLLVGGYFGYAASTGPCLEGEVLLQENDTVELGPNGWVAVTEDASWWPWSNDRELVLHNLVTGEETSFPDNPSVGLVLPGGRSEEHTSELQSRFDLVCRLLPEKKKTLCAFCSTKNTVMPSVRIVSITSRIWALIRGAKPNVGSSSNNKRRLASKARPLASMCCP